MTLPDGFPTVTGGDLAVVRAGTGGELTAEQMRDLTCSQGSTVLVLIVPPVRRVSDDAGHELGRALYLADRIDDPRPGGRDISRRRDRRFPRRAP